MSIQINYSDGEYYVSQYLASLGYSFGTCYLAIADADVPSSMRWRSRGRHDPGSGNYSCTTVRFPGDISGFRIGNDIYLTYLPLVVIPYYGGYQIRSLSKRHVEVTTVEHGSWGWGGVNHFTTINYHYYELDHIDGRFAYFNSWSYYKRFEGSWIDPLTVRSVAVQEATYSEGGYSWARMTTQDALRPLTKLERDQVYLSDSVEIHPNWNVHLNSAYLDAFSSLPAITTNNIQNLLMVFGALKNLLTGNIGRLDSVGTIQDAWMGYRYGYSTSASDIRELASYVDRMRTFRKLSGVRGHGQYKWGSEDNQWLIKCSIECTSADYLNCYTDIERLGLALDGYNTWDMIPYSFIVDWFLRIGDLLEDARTRNYALKLTPSAVWFSVTHDYTNSAGCHQCDFYRWRARDLTFANTLPSSYLSDASASKSTWVKRGADAIALLT